MRAIPNSSIATALLVAVAVAVIVSALIVEIAAGEPRDAGPRERAVRAVVDAAERCDVIHRALQRAASRDAGALADAYVGAVAELRLAAAAAGDPALSTVASRIGSGSAADGELLGALETAAARALADVAAGEARSRDAARRGRTAASFTIALLVCLAAFALAALAAAESRRLDRALPKGRSDEGLVARAERLAGKAAGAFQQQIALVGERVELARLLHTSAATEEALRYEVRENRDRIERLEVAHMNDELTGVLNFKYFLLRLGQALEEFVTAGQPFCLLALDLDDFKGINDGYGHHVGDAALRELAAVLRRSVRGDDVVFRKSGDEFYVLMPGATPDDGEALANRLLATVNGHEVVYEGAGETYRVALATSIGVLHCGQVDPHLLVSLSRDQLLSETYGFADAALFKAKYAGKGCARIYTTGLTVRGVNPAEYPPDLDSLHRETRARYPHLPDMQKRAFNEHLTACRALLGPLRLVAARRDRAPAEARER